MIAMARYIGIFLDPPTRDALLRDFPAVHSDVRAAHITLTFEPSRSEMARVPCGTPVRFTVVGHAADAKGQALRVELPAEYMPADGRIPHVTLSLAPDVAAVYSNELLRRGAQAIEPRTYVGRLDVHL